MVLKLHLAASLVVKLHGETAFKVLLQKLAENFHVYTDERFCCQFCLYDRRLFAVLSERKKSPIELDNIFTDII